MVIVLCYFNIPRDERHVSFNIFLNSFYSVSLSSVILMPFSFVFLERLSGVDNAHHSLVCMHRNTLRFADNGRFREVPYAATMCT